MLRWTALLLQRTIAYMRVVARATRRAVVRLPMRGIMPFVLASSRANSSNKLRNNVEHAMSWKSPKIVEIALGAEINSYACAEAKK